MQHIYYCWRWYFITTKTEFKKDVDVVKIREKDVKVVHYSPIYTESQRISVIRAISASLYHVFKKYV